MTRQPKRIKYHLDISGLLTMQYFEVLTSKSCHVCKRASVYSSRPRESIKTGLEKKRSDLWMKTQKRFASTALLEDPNKADEDDQLMPPPLPLPVVDLCAGLSVLSCAYIVQYVTLSGDL